MDSDLMTRHHVSVIWACDVGRWLNSQKIICQASFRRLRSPAVGMSGSEEGQRDIVSGWCITR
ncbi:hypothetical protein PanWU01x14_119610, partial [Parasponia andersonii]